MARRRFWAQSVSSLFLQSTGQHRRGGRRFSQPDRPAFLPVLQICRCAAPGPGNWHRFANSQVQIRLGAACRSHCNPHALAMEPANPPSARRGRPLSPSGYPVQLYRHGASLSCIFPTQVTPGVPRGHCLLMIASLWSGPLSPPPFPSAGPWDSLGLGGVFKLPPSHTTTTTGVIDDVPHCFSYHCFSVCSSTPSIPRTLFCHVHLEPSISL